MRGQGTLLIVDDDSDLVRLLSRVAEAAGLSTLCLIAGKKVVEVAATEQPDVILLDIELPDADGRDILRALKLNPRTFHVPVFVYSGRSSHADRITALELGAADYLEKPFQAQMLIRRILHGLDKVRSTSASDLPREVDRRSSEKLRIERAERLSRGAIRLDSKRSRQSVLVVEDDSDVRSCICDILGDEGLETWPARNGEEALDMLRKGSLRPSVILLDLTLPEMDGREFHERLSKDPTIPPTPVIVMSDIVPSLSIASLPWLQKPLSLGDLLSAVHAVAR